MDAAGGERIGMRTGRQRAMAFTVGLLVATALLACTDLESPADLAPDSIWEAELTPLVSAPTPDAPVVSGRAGAVVQNGRTTVGILLNGIEEPLQWGLFQGSCRQPGARVGTADAYPTLSPEQTSAEVSLATELSRSGSYHVRAGPDPDGTDAVACGELVRR